MPVGHAQPYVSELGERLFRDARFSQASYAAKATRNAVPQNAVSCATCHQSRERESVKGRGLRSFADFYIRTPVPVRRDSHRVTARNTPALIGIWAERTGPKLFHYDGEFSALEDLSIETWVGRNFGWKPEERALALKHVADTLRAHYGGEISKMRRLDSAKAAMGDQELIWIASNLISNYVRQLDFPRNSAGEIEGSAYDAFLKRNALPRALEPRETEAQYAARLKQAVDSLSDPSYGWSWDFRQQEWRGLRLFLGKANCASCHQPPSFTDFSFHNAGVSQQEYDRVHGEGAFKRYPFPTLSRRNAELDRFAPAVPTKQDPAAMDLGAWHVVMNPRKPRPQFGLRTLICEKHAGCSPESLFERAFARFKTPTLRLLAYSTPYLHDGSARTVGAAIRSHLKTAELSRQGLLLNPDPELTPLTLSDSEIEDLEAFLKTLNQGF